MSIERSVQGQLVGRTDAGQAQSPSSSPDGTEGLFRTSVGLERVTDLIDDLDAAPERA
jgi:cystathionine beta-lyase/cystathionine gamma-synthase